MWLRCRIEERLSDPSFAAAPAPGAEGAPLDLGGLEEKLEQIVANAQEQGGSDDSATKAIGTLKRDFSLLVHTINGHLQVESTLEEVKAALVPIARHVGVEIGQASPAEAESVAGDEATESDD